jgi:hypothetical protein
VLQPRLAFRSPSQSVVTAAYWVTLRATAESNICTRPQVRVPWKLLELSW